MMTKMNVTVLVPSELLYAFDPDQEHIFIAARERGMLVLRPYGAGSEHQCNTDEISYRNGYLVGMSDGYHKGYSDALAFEDLILERKANDKADSRCIGYCNACPQYDDLFDVCRLYG